jgi:hypothetical protein
MEESPKMVRLERARKVAELWRERGGDLKSNCAMASGGELIEAFNDLRVEVGEKPILLPIREIEKKMRQIGFLS